MPWLNAECHRIRLSGSLDSSGGEDQEFQEGYRRSWLHLWSRILQTAGRPIRFAASSRGTCSMSYTCRRGRTSGPPDRAGSSLARSSSPTWHLSSSDLAGCSLLVISGPLSLFSRVSSRRIRQRRLARVSAKGQMRPQPDRLHPSGCSMGPDRGRTEAVRCEAALQ